MAKSRILLILGMAITGLAVLAACATSTPTPSPTSTPTAKPTGGPGVVTSVKVDKAPVLDGQADDLWAKASEVSIAVSGGANMGSTTVLLRSVYTNDSVYFLAHWADPTKSERRSPWQKQADGSWAKVKDPDDKGGDNNKVYEDKFAMIWNIGDSIKGFNEQGCMATCHAGEPGKAFGNKYTANEGEMGDIWHWKSIRTGPVGQFDDQYVDNTRYDKDKSPEAGRKSDAKTGGGYVDNQTTDGKLPAYAAKDNKPVPPYWIVDGERVAFDDSKYKAGDEVAGIIVAAFTGDRGDISAKFDYRNGHYYVEWSRKLNTGSKTDVQFTDLSKKYAFGVAVFDNAQVRHAYQTSVSWLEFKPAG